MTGSDGAVTTRTEEAADPKAIAEFTAIEDHDQMQSALADLPDLHRAALLLTVVYGCTHAEAATRLGVSDRTIRTWCSNAAAQLRRQLGEA